MTPAQVSAQITPGDGCWAWGGAHSGGGYSVARVDGVRVLVHRWTYELLVGPIPAGLELDHLCRNRGCVNPAHLEAVTHRENTLRGDTIPTRRVAQTHCDRGHPFDDANTARYPDATRRCRACTRITNARAAARRRLAA